MFNVIINNEQYDEFLAQKEKIKELEARNEFLKEQYDQLNEKCQANSDHYQGLYEELVQTVNEKKKTLESLYKNYQQALSDKVALIKERDDLLIENDELKNKVTRFGELVSENYRLRQSIADLKANNKELKAEKEALLLECDRLDKKHKEHECLKDQNAALKAKDNKISDLCGQLDKALNERNEYKDLYMNQIIKTNELRFENDKVVNELESVKAKIKEPVATITIKLCRDSEEAYSPDNNTNTKIENLYITNNYFSEEDKNNE